jgi:hypothetical protein
MYDRSSFQGTNQYSSSARTGASPTRRMPSVRDQSAHDRDVNLDQPATATRVDPASPAQTEGQRLARLCAITWL